MTSQYGCLAQIRTEIVGFVDRNPKSFERQSHNLKLVSGLRLELRTQGSRPWMFPLHYPLMVRNKRVERFPLLSRSRRPPLPQFLIGQRPPNRTASTSIRGSEATTTPVTDKLTMVPTPGIEPSLLAFQTSAKTTLAQLAKMFRG